MRRKLLFASTIFGFLLGCSAAVQAQEFSAYRKEITLQGTGFFTKDTDGRGISRSATNTGGFLLGFRYRFNRWTAAEVDYGYSRNTQNVISTSALAGIQANSHQTTAAFVLTPPVTVAKLRPYALAGSGALVFSPTNHVSGLGLGADTQAKAAFVYGGGVNYDLSRHIALKMEYRGLVFKAPDFQVNNLKLDAMTHVAQPSLGVSIRF